jgi:hypothetical protein
LIQALIGYSFAYFFNNFQEYERQSLKTSDIINNIDVLNKVWFNPSPHLGTFLHIFFLNKAGF